MGMSADEAALRVRELFNGTANCAEAVLKVMQEVYGLPADILPAASGFGGGIGACQSTCGAITGGVIAASVHASATTPDSKQATVNAKLLAEKVYKSFATRFEHTDCRTLTGFDFSAPGGYKAFRDRDKELGLRFCTPFVEYVVRLLTEA
ncbi:MAG: C_GCAxxG_C_C family protein [Chloroflexi bacterium]|nr:C_GCAxxG_C_C family protein [Chloroflexota bacterium]